MVNIEGRNGHDNGDQPPEDALKKALMQYAVEKLTLAQRCKRLQVEYNYHISESTLKRLNRKYNIPSARKPPPQPLSESLIREEMDKDLQHRNGPNAIGQLLAVKGFIIPRSTIRVIMRLEDPLGPQIRAPGNKVPINRSPLQSMGPFAEVSCDGHEKLSSMALGIGPVGIPIYGMRDKFSGRMLHLVVVPNARLSVTIGHVYLDFVENYGAIPFQITVDKGSETGDMLTMQITLRKLLLDHDVEKWPPVVALRSVHNIRIEKAWSLFLQNRGFNIQQTLREAGPGQGIYNVNNPIHQNLFLWLWPPIVQVELDGFVEYWNTHRIRTQPNSLLPSGCTPNHAYQCPEEWEGQKMHTPVPLELIQQLRETLPLTRAEAFRWVDDNFAVLAEHVYAEIGRPLRSIQTGWLVFQRMSPLIQNYVNNA
ncbi:hypothetical protein K474DRAFT_1710205 [Panus rudis PR-1116 ss-1]|nr:hypothetical protein K474DRAFT_1714045 [Panus rudis PR-1116 ss-1]KAI0074065.1 hypothetical protein K474DRAFT_1710205 [Panus rudis PR-1116 ss-1]